MNGRLLYVSNFGSRYLRSLEQRKLAILPVVTSWVKLVRAIPILCYKQAVIHSLQWHGQPFVVSEYVVMRYRSFNNNEVSSSWQNEIHKNGIE